MDHDRLFKELLSNFFLEFVELLLPDVAAFLDRDTAMSHSTKKYSLTSASAKSTKRIW